MNLDNSCILTAEIDFVKIEQGDEIQKIKNGTQINLNKHWGVLVYKRPQFKVAKPRAINAVVKRAQGENIDDNRWL